MSASSTPSQTGGSVSKAVSTPRKWPSKKFYKETVSVLVGPAKERYTLHKGLLCFYSDFFRAAFQGSFKEANEGKIELPDVETVVFEAFQVWLYSGSLRALAGDEDSSKPPNLPAFSTLAYLWVFGDKFQIPLLQNCVADSLLENLEEKDKFSTHVVDIAYQHTMEGSALRRLAIDVHVFMQQHRTGESSVFRPEALCRLSKEALVDFARCMSVAWEEKMNRYAMPTVDRCHYHVHAADEHC